MTEKMRKAAADYRLSEVSTPERLEMQGLKTISYKNQIICIGYYYTYRGNDYYAAIYEFTGEDKTCEGECRLVWISPERYEDEGHALKRAFES